MKKNETITDYELIKKRAVEQFGEKEGSLFPTTVPEQLAHSLFGYYYDTTDDGYEFENQELVFVTMMEGYNGCEWYIYRLMEA